MADPQAKKVKLPSGRHKSQIKRQRQNVKIAAINKLIRSDMRTFVKKVREAAASKDMTVAKELLKTTVRKIDKAVSKKILHRNNAARKISRLTRLVDSLAK